MDYLARRKPIMDNSIRFWAARSAGLSKFGILFLGGNKMRATHTMTNLIGNRSFDNRRQANPFTRVISFFRIWGSDPHSIMEADHLAQIIRKTRPMVDIGPMIRNR
jgi:hypothetical protein